MSFIVNCKSTNSMYWNRNEITISYFNDIKKFPLLSYEEERKLLIATKTENREKAELSIKRLIECNQRFVVSVARRMCGTENLLDIVNEGNLGLYKAIEHYDITKKERFITYAIFWIRKYINNYIATKDKVLVPYNAQKLYNYLYKINNHFLVEHERYPTTEEIRNMLDEKYNIKVSSLEELIPCTISSIDEELMDKKDQECRGNIVHEFSLATSNNNIYDKINNDDNKKLINRLLSTLSERDKNIIENYYGIDTEELRIDQIAEKFDLTKERVRQIINKSLGTLRTKINNFKEY